MKHILLTSLVAVPLMFIEVQVAETPAAQDSQRPAGIIQGTVLKYARDLRSNMQARERVVGAEVTLKGKDILRVVRITEGWSLFSPGSSSGNLYGHMQAPARQSYSRPPVVQRS